MNLSDFIQSIKSKSFIDKPLLQEELMEFAIKSSSFELLLLLCLEAEQYPNTAFAVNILTKELKEVASIDQLLYSLKILNKLPTAEIFERVFEEGSSEQIQKLSEIRNSWLHKEEEGMHE